MFSMSGFLLGEVGQYVGLEGDFTCKLRLEIV